MELCCQVDAANGKLKIHLSWRLWEAGDSWLSTLRSPSISASSPSFLVVSTTRDSATHLAAHIPDSLFLNRLGWLTACYKASLAQRSLVGLSCFPEWLPVDTTKAPLCPENSTASCLPGRSEPSHELPADCKLPPHYTSGRKKTVSLNSFYSKCKNFQHCKICTILWASENNYIKARFQVILTL